MLEDGIRVMVYAGDLDLICNWVGNERWVPRWCEWGVEARGTQVCMGNKRWVRVCHWGMCGVG